MSCLNLPPSSPGKTAPSIKGARRITLIGANGAGKTRFMEEMAFMAKGKAYMLSALSASFPEREESTLPGSIDSLYREAIRQQTYMRTDAVSELDKLIYMVFADELEYLLSVKEHGFGEGKRIRLKPTKLDRIKELWERIFPGNRITRNRGTLMFATNSGDDLISATSLSQGEKTVLYYAAAVLYAMPDAVIFIDSPTLFIHPTVIGPLWDALEELRPDCTFVYNSVDVDFVSSLRQNTCIWVKSYSSEHNVWDYEVIRDLSLTEDILKELAGSRRPVIFIEGDTQHSIDYKLYSLVFTDWTIRPLGSCDKVIETTRTFNDLKYMHHMLSRGIVDRDRRTPEEVNYLRRKNIMVPEVAEVENIFLLESVIRVMARRRGRDPEKVMRKVSREVFRSFRQKAEQQVLQHVRHKVKRDVERLVDGRFSCITALETHLKTLVYKLEPRKNYNRLREDFAAMVRDSDYAGILRVFNHKPMLPESGVHQLLGYRTKDEYISGVIEALKTPGKDADALRQAVRRCLLDTEYLTEQSGA